MPTSACMALALGAGALLLGCTERAVVLGQRLEPDAYAEPTTDTAREDAMPERSSHVSKRDPAASCMHATLERGCFSEGLYCELGESRDWRCNEALRCTRTPDGLFFRAVAAAGCLPCPPNIEQGAACDAEAPYPRLCPADERLAAPARFISCGCVHSSVDPETGSWACVDPPKGCDAERPHLGVRCADRSAVCIYGEGLPGAIGVACAADGSVVLAGAP
jgi:hypothetical protein